MSSSKANWEAVVVVVVVPLVPLVPFGVFVGGWSVSEGGWLLWWELVVDGEEWWEGEWAGEDVVVGWVRVAAEAEGGGEVAAAVLVVVPLPLHRLMLLLRMASRMASAAA